MRMPQLRKSVLPSWLISYGTILLVTMLSSILIHASASEALQQEISRGDAAVLRNTQLVLDSRLAEMQLTASLLRQDDNFKAFVHDPHPFYKSDLSLRMAAAKLRMAQISDGSLIIGDIYLHSLRSGVTLSTKYGLNDDEGFRLPTQEAFGATAAQFREVIGRVSDHPTYELIPDESGGRTVMLLLYPMYNQSVQVEGVLILRMEPDFLLLETPEAEKVFQLLIVGSGDRRMAADDGNPILTRLQAEDYDEASQIVTKDRVRYHVSTISSAIFDWKYVAVTNLNVYTSRIRTVRDRSMAVVLVFLALGSIVSVVMARRQYMPVRQLLAKVSQLAGAGGNRPTNEFQQLESAMQDIFSEKERYSQMLRRQAASMQNILLNRLLKGRIYSQEQARDMLIGENIDFPYGHFLVIVMAIEDYGTLLDTDEEDPSMHGVSDLSQIIVKNILEETFADGAVTRVLETDEHPVCIVNLDPNRFDRDAALKVLKRGLDVIREHFGLIVSAGLGAVHENHIGVAAGFQEAMETLESSRMTGSPGEIAVFDASGAKLNRLVQHVRHLETRRMLLNHLLVENFEAAREISMDFLRVLETSKAPNAHRYITYWGLIEDLSAAYDAICGEHAALKRPGMARLLHDLQTADTVQECRRLILAILEELIAIREEKDRLIQQDDKFNQIRQYIADNLGDCGLSVSGLSRAVGLSISRIARTIRGQVGLSTLDYIQKMRMDETKRLLLETDLPIVEISRRVGYENFRTLNALFKKNEGITGTQYRQKNQVQP